MADEGRPDHWALLASILGAEQPLVKEKPKAVEPPSEVVEEIAETWETPAPAAIPAVEVPEVESPPVRTRIEEPRGAPVPAARRSANDWARLAATLGIDVPLEVPEPKAAPAPAEMARSEWVESTRADDLPSDPPSYACETIEEPDDLDIQEVLPDGGTADPEMVESVDTDSEAAQEEDRPRKRRRKRRRRSRRPEESVGEESAVEESAVEESLIERADGEEDEEEAEFVSDTDSEVEPRASEEEEETRTRKRRRRRRKGSRRVREDAVERAPVDDVADDAADDDADEADDLLAAAPLLDDDDDDVVDHEDDGDEVDRAMHLGIPTWDEAVGVVIAANMEARARNPAGPSRGRGRPNRSGRDRSR